MLFLLMWQQNIAFELWQASLVPHSDSGPSFSVEIRLKNRGLLLDCGRSAVTRKIFTMNFLLQILYSL